jgi:putative ABC transport system ATP-binding protein
MASEPVIELRGVGFAHGAGGFALRVEELVLGAGEVAACIGPSGCGKTTLLHVVAGVLAAGRGTVRVLGAEVSAMSDAERRAFRLGRLGMVFQEFELLEHMTALDNILLGAIIRAGRATPGEREAAERLAAEVGIGHVLARTPARLSQGERQRVGICRAMVGSPGLILCDEPTGNLDPAATVATLELILTRARASGAGVLMVTHNHQVLDRFDRVIEMRAGVVS